jgi:hypothetical protein
MGQYPRDAHPHDQARASLKKFLGYLRLPEGRLEFSNKTDKLNEPTPDDWIAIKCLRNLLVPFEAASKFLLSEKVPTISAAAPALRHIDEKLSNTAVFDWLLATDGMSCSFEVGEMMHLVRQGMGDLFAQRIDKTRRALAWLPIFDPRMATTLVNGPDGERAKSALLKAMMETHDNLSPSTPPAATYSTPHSPIPTPQKGEDELYASMFGNRRSSQQQAASHSSEPDSIHAQCVDEMDMYIVAVKDGLNDGVGPLDWWRVNGKRFPTIRKLARKWLACMATSVPSERAFSTAGNILTVKRACLQRDIARDLIFVAHNFKD